MSRKTKQTTHKLFTPHIVESSVLAIQAEAALVAKNFKEAIELYKQLVKREAQAGWLNGLACSYEGRAREIAAKGMIKEALVLWRNRTQLCGKPLAEGPYFDWLLLTGDQAEMINLLSCTSLPDLQRAELETCLAAFILTAQKLPPIPAESALLRHRNFALQALAAYHLGDFAALVTALQLIPIRSPYRDLKPLLKALALLPTDPSGAQSLLTRLPAGGPFERLATVLRAAALPSAQWLALLSNLDENSRQLLLDIKGCPDTLRPLLLELSKVGDQLSAKALYDLLLRFRRYLAEEKLNSLLLRLMPHLNQSLRGNTDYKKLPAEKQAQIQALAHEIKGNNSDAQHSWIDLTKILHDLPNQKLREALVMRHVAELSNQQGNKPEFEYLQYSLELDPEDHDCFLTIIRLLRTDNQLAKARSYLERAMQVFPKNAELLLEAVEIALAAKTFKKAVGLAKQVLELDPINPKVKGLIGTALLSQTRKQIKAGSYVLANKELAAAREWLKTPCDLATLNVLRALAAGDQVDIHILKNATTGFASPLVAAFHVLLEAYKVDFNPKRLLQDSGIDVSSPPAPQAVLELAHTLHSMPDEQKLVRNTLAPLRNLLKRATKAKFLESEHRFICEVWLRFEEKELLLAYTKAALNHWPNSPAFIYFSTLADYGKDIYRIPDHELNALGRAASEAQKQGDHRTADQIYALLSQADEARSFNDEDDETFYPFEDMPDNPFEHLPGTPRAMLERILSIAGEKGFLEFMQKSIGKEAINELKSKLGTKNFCKKLIDILVEGPDIKHSGFF